ncbi:EF-Tu/IF-2/RF-3 family GTPase [Ectopseudomonas alcaliphila]|uniref:EF-Tu/IF-2/RF-3 family GTPase n=1 Tax=Ectopseudomonas alcaliphila TaxID=101564 RepID=UPI002786D0AF|nr:MULTISPECIES: EF-Tu/IF-2/RF-3 family GTPase [Pseudomonas]MDP9941428.1 elongation factor Tu [Pseudomonas sp. 3400]MDR7013647.1 elongation factor Tu [Pseudomonas alcaliphila]
MKLLLVALLCAGLLGAALLWSRNAEAVLGDRVHVNLVTLGAEDAGARDLTEALFGATSGRLPEREDIVDAGEVKYLEYGIGGYQYAHAVLPAVPRNLSAIYQALQSTDTAIVSIDADAGVSDAVLEQCLWARAAGVPRFLVFAWTAEGATRIDEQQITNRFVACDYPAGDIAIVLGKGVRLGAHQLHFPDVKALLGALAEVARPRERSFDAPFAMHVDDVFQISGKGTILTGRIESGQVRRGARLSLYEDGIERTVTITNIETFRRQLDVAGDGDHVGLTVSGITRSDVARGAVLATPGSVRQSKLIKATLSSPNFLAASTKAQSDASDYMVLLQTTTVPAKIERSGDLVELRLSDAIPLRKGWRFLLLEEGRTVGAGMIED